MGEHLWETIYYDWDFSLKQTPFAESKEALGGYFYLQVANMDKAVEIAKQCPGLEHGCVVEVRPVARGAQSARVLEQVTRREQATRRLFEGRTNL